MQSLTRVFARKTAAASNFGRLSLWWGLFWWHFCLEAEQNCECWCSSKSEKAWSWLRWCLETLKYRKSITSINHIYGQFGSNTYCPYFHHGLYILLPQKHMSVWIFSSTTATNFSMVLKYHNSKLKLCGFSWHVWRIRKQLDQRWHHQRSYSRSISNRTWESVRAPLENDGPEWICS